MFRRVQSKSICSENNPVYLAYTFYMEQPLKVKEC